MPDLHARNLHKAFGKKKVVDGVDLEIRMGEIVGLLGPNGAGKTTTFYMVIGMIRPDQGSIHLGDWELTSDPMHVRAIKGIGYLPQEPSVFKKLTVRENILIILEYRPGTEDEKKKTAQRVLEELGIAHLSGQKAGLLSGGERRRLEIARSLATGPAFILLDEPFAGIDPLAVMDIKQIIIQLKEKGIGILISDHNVKETLAVCDRAYILNCGKVIEKGTPDRIASSRIARKIYLGDEFCL